jgi:large subunit ribosomal protein L24e
MVKCVFCGREENSFKGVHLIGNNGSVSYFCSSKCRKNTLNLKRDKRNFKWTAAYHEEREKKIARAVVETKAKGLKAEKAKEEANSTEKNIKN